MNMRILVLGGSGFIGRHLISALHNRGDTAVVGSMRDPKGAAKLASSCEVVVNLAGEPIAQRWSTAVKERLASSRIERTDEFISALATLPRRPGAYIAASAIGYYGSSASETFDESSPHGDDFLGNLCLHWENASLRAADLGIRVALVRTGIVLGADGGVLGGVLPLFRLGLGGKIASGTQWFSWIHLADQIGIYLAAIDGLEGILNATSPHPVTNAEFTAVLATALNRPAILSVPAFALHALLGEGSVIALGGQRVLPKRTLELGYRFLYPQIRPAIADILRC